MQILAGFPVPDSPQDQMRDTLYWVEAEAATTRVLFLLRVLIQSPESGHRSGLKTVTPNSWVSLFASWNYAQIPGSK
jgi:hypothetical protein